MPSLFGNEYNSSDRRVARSISGVISTVAQIGLAIAVASISTATAPRVTRSPLSPSLVYSVFLPVSEPAIPVPPARVEAAVKEPAPEFPKPNAPRMLERPVAPTPKPTAEEPGRIDVAPPAPPSPVAPTAPFPTPSVGTFPTAATIAPTPAPPRRVEVAGFDTAAGQTSQLRVQQTAIGAFETASAPGSRADGSSNRRLVSESGFSEGSPAAPSTPQARTVAASGFGSSSTQERVAPEKPAPQQAGFGDARVVEPSRRAETTSTAPAIVPVSVLSKPSPVYTDEARRLRIEGAVVLEVEFCACGQVRVVRVVRGLGHGLDESATDAARNIQFKPATNEGRPVDYRTTVQIVFRLA